VDATALHGHLCTVEYNSIGQLGQKVKILPWRAEEVKFRIGKNLYIETIARFESDVKKA
jgi:hypothetical protein